MVLDDFRLVGIVDLIGVLDLDWIRFLVRRKYRTRGRRAFDPVVMFKALLVGYFKNLDYRGLSLFLKKNPQVAFSCGFNGRNPNFSSFSRFRKRLGYKMIKKIFIKIVYELYLLKIINFDKISVDSTMIPTYVNKFRLDNDSEALFGYSWTKGWVYGYKDHSLVDISSDLPIDFVVTTANIHDSKALIPLLKQANINNNNTSELYGDKAYCYKSERDFVTKKIKIDYVVSFRRNMQIYKLSQNQKTLIEYFQWKEARIIPSNSVEGKKKYPLKQSVERHFSHEKTFFNIDNPQFRGKESIAITITLAKISILLFALAMVKLGFPEHIRKYSILKTC